MNTDEAVLELALTQIYKEINAVTGPEFGRSSLTIDYGKNYRFHNIWRKIKEELEKDGYTVHYNDVFWKMTINW